MDDMTDPKAVNDKIPSGLHMMNHIVRSTAYSTHTKCFLNTKLRDSKCTINVGYAA